MDTRQNANSAIMIDGATLPIQVTLGAEVTQVELIASTGAVVLTIGTRHIVCPHDRIAYGETGDGQQFREFVGALYLDAADRQGIPVSVV